MYKEFMGSDDVDARRLYQNQTQEFFTRILEQVGQNPNSLQNPEERVRVLKSLDSDQFFDLLSITNSKLRGEYKRWKRNYQGRAERAVVISGLLDSPDIEPPQEPENEFEKLFLQMKKDLTVDNLRHWGTKMYTGIIFLHMFPDGNGRLARNVASFLSEGKLSTEDATAVRPSLISEYCRTVNSFTIENLLEKNDCTELLPDNKKFGGIARTMFYIADERPNFDSSKEAGLVGRLKFIAAKRAGILNSRIDPSQLQYVSQCYSNGEVCGFSNQRASNGELEGFYSIITTPWTEEETQRFKDEFQKVRQEWFWQNQKDLDAEANNKFVDTYVDIALNVPNPFFLKISTMIKLMKFASKGIEEEVTKLLDTDRYSQGRSQQEKDAFKKSIMDLLHTYPAIFARVEQLT